MKYNLSDIIDFNLVTIFQHYGTVTFILTVFLEIIYGITVYYTIDKKMKYFRFFTFFYIFNCVLGEFLMLCLKPYALFPYSILYPVGVLSPMSSTATAFVVALYCLCLMLEFCTLTFLILERHFLVVSYGKEKIKKIRKYFYSSLIVSCFLSFAFFSWMNLENLDDFKVQEILKSEVLNSDVILQIQPSLFMGPLTFNVSYVLLAFLFFSILGFIVAISIALFVIYENYKLTKSNMQISENTKKQLDVMFQANLIQFLTGLIFAIFLGAYIITFYSGKYIIFYFNNNAFIIDWLKIISDYSFLTFLFYPIADVILVIAGVRGYRNTFKKLIKSVFSKFMLKRNIPSVVGPL